MMFTEGLNDKKKDCLINLNAFFLISSFFVGCENDDTMFCRGDMVKWCHRPFQNK